MSYATMNRAKAQKDDEWYTKMEDVAKEIPLHARSLYGKTVICPCDHPKKSRIYLYLKQHFRDLGLKSLISSHYENPRSFVTVFDGERERVYNLQGNGDFLSSEVLAWTRKADVIITNPPFSLIQKWMDVILPMGIKFLYVCPFYVTSYSNVFDYFKRDKVTFENHWIRRFDNNPKPLGMVGWLTNLPVRPYPPLTFTHTYSPDKYDYLQGKWAGILHVPKIALIPRDYYGPMAVPPTIVYNINRSQFKVLDLIHSPGKGIFKRIVIQRVR